MAISNFRAVIETARGSVSRLAKGWQQATVNDGEIGVEVLAAASSEKRWSVRMRPVLGISSAGAQFGQAFADLALSEADIADLRSGRLRLAMVPATQA